MSAAADQGLPPLGGYLGLELPRGRREPMPTAHRFQSARAALTALLRARRPRRLWLPRLVCDAVPSAAAAAGVPTSYYGLDPEDGTPAGVDLGRGDLLLIVDLFGVMAGATRKVLQRFEPDQVVADHAQAFFRPPPACLATVYSPRKFFGLPDGGLLVTNVPVAAPPLQDDESVRRTSHLLRRLAGGPEEGYAEFQAAEASLSDCEPKAMSALTRHLLAAVDAAQVRSRRAKNFAAVHRRLAATNLWPWALPASAPALAYTYLRDRPRDNDRMRRVRLYVATYWPEAARRCAPGSLEATLLERLLPLPIDQRLAIGPGYWSRLRDADIH